MNGKVAYWLKLCDEDLLTAKALLDSERFLHMGLFCHMIVEKGLKAVIADKTNEMPPKIHDLEKLAVIGGMYDHLTEGQRTLLQKLIPLQIEARYSEYSEEITSTLTIAYCSQLLGETEAFLCWIKNQLEN